MAVLIKAQPDKEKISAQKMMQLRIFLNIVLLKVILS